MERFMDPTIVKDTLKIWENIFQKHEWGKYPPIPLVRFIAKNFYSRPNRRDVKILELGSGPGPNLWYMAREGFMIFGIDGSETACKRAQNRLIEEKLDKQIGAIISGDYYGILKNFENNYFDAIIDTESLCCNPFARTREIILTCFEKLRPGGKMFSMTFADGTYGLSGDEIEYHALFPEKGPMANQGLTRYTTREDIDTLYTDKNIKLTSLQRQDLLIDIDKENCPAIKEWIIELQKIQP